MCRISRDSEPQLGPGAQSGLQKNMPLSRDPLVGRRQFLRLFFWVREMELAGLVIFSPILVAITNPAKGGGGGSLVSERKIFGFSHRPHWEFISQQSRGLAITSNFTQLNPSTPSPFPFLAVSQLYSSL
jgi:hypothetical protein